MVEGQSFVCRVEKTRWPVSAARMLNLRGLEVAGLTDEDHVGVLAEEGPERGGERPADALVDLDLVDALQVVLDRILGGHDVHVRRVDGVDSLSRAWWSCQDPVGPVISTMPYGW